MPDDTTRTTFVIQLDKLKSCVQCKGKVKLDEVKWKRGRDEMSCPRGVCAGCGWLYYAIPAFSYWEYFVNGGKRPS